ncbi:MAG: enoyl-CoA hydratase-related protein [Bacteroidota bacterium]
MSSVLFTISKGVGFITLNRPEKLNSINHEMALLLKEKLDECASDVSVRAVYITGTGKGFCTGQDLEEAVNAGDESFDDTLSKFYNPIVMAIRSLQKPIVAAVNGVAAGAGANIALCCDIVVAAQSASFIQAFSKIGLVPDSGGTHTLPRLIGWQKASALMLLAEKVPAQEAMNMGMIYKVIPDESFADESVKIVSRLAQMPTKGLALTKEALQSSLQKTLEEQLHVEDLFQRQAARTHDFKEGIAAFLAKRQPLFTGE